MYRNETAVESNQILRPNQVGRTPGMFYSLLLKWMDIAACVSAEKHAKMSCVTVAMDDLKFKQHQVKPGNLVTVRAQVNRAFGSSMEVGVLVWAERIESGDKIQICQGFFTFVATSDVPRTKVQLAPVQVITEEEQKQHVLAFERRKIRQASLHNICNIVQDLQRTVPESSRIGLSRDDVGRKVECRRTTVESLELVMPQHANHHGTAFGGQILEWMGNVAFIAASRVCQTVMTMPVALDRVIFRRPANVGDRLFLKACVNAIFHTTMEVGVRVEAQAVGGEARHISSAFTTFAVSSDTDSVIVLPQLETSNEIEKRRCSEAQARYFSRLSRKSLSDGEKSVLHWSETETLEMSLENMSRLASLMAVSEWQPINDDSEVKLHKYEQDENVAIKLQFEIDGSAKEVYTLVSDIKQRQHWDKLCRQSHILRRITDTDAIVQLIMDPMQLGHNAKEFVLLASHHFASCDNDYYALALTSIEYQLSYGYQASNCERAEVLSSGYVVRELPFEGPSEEGRAKCCVTYFHQLSATVLPYIGGDLVGLTAVLINTGRRLKSYITTKLISDHSEG